MRTCAVVFAVSALWFCACANVKIIRETAWQASGSVDRRAVYFGWIDFGGDEAYYQHGYETKEEWQRTVASMNQAYHGWVSAGRGARSPTDVPEEGDILLGVKEVLIPSELRDGDKWVMAVVYLEEVGTKKVLYQAAIRVRADSWGFEGALNQATFRLAGFVNDLLNRS